MRKVVVLFTLGLAVTAITFAVAQPPGGKGKKDKGGKGFDASSLVTRLLAFDKDKDGKLTKEEVTDERLHRLFDQADANKDGVVTKEELEALAAKLQAEFQGEGGKGGKGGMEGKRGFGGPGGRGGFAGPGGFGPPQPGQVLPAFLLERLNLTAEQKKQLDALQKDVDERLAKILTAAQKKQMQEMRPRFGPGGPGGPGGPPPDEKKP